VNNSDMPAMPHTEYDKDGNLPTGLTKLEYFAGKVIQGFAADPQIDGHAESIAIVAIDWADALLAALERRQAK